MAKSPNMKPIRMGDTASNRVNFVEFLDMYAAVAHGSFDASAESIKTTLEFMLGEAGAQSVISQSSKFMALLNDSEVNETDLQATSPGIATMSASGRVNRERSKQYASLSRSEINECISRMLR